MRQKNVSTPKRAFQGCPACGAPPLNYGVETYSCFAGHSWPKPKIVEITTSRGTILMSQPAFRRLGHEIFAEHDMKRMESRLGRT